MTMGPQRSASNLSLETCGEDGPQGRKQGGGKRKQEALGGPQDVVRPSAQPNEH